MTQPPAAEGGTEADAVAAAVRRCPGVVRLDAGGVPQVATYLPGRRVEGVRVGDRRIEVCVVGAYGTPVAELDAQIRTALAPLARGRAVDIHVAGVALAGEPTRA